MEQTWFTSGHLNQTVNDNDLLNKIMALITKGFFSQRAIFIMAFAR